MRTKIIFIYVFYSLFLLVNPTMTFADVCFSKPEFPNEEFSATVRYEIVADDVIKFVILVEGVDPSFDKELEVFYGVANEFKWSLDEMYKANYEFSTKLLLNNDEDTSESKLYVRKDFESFVLHLRIIPTSNDNKNYCQSDFLLLIAKNSLNRKIRKGTVGSLQLLK